MSGILHFKQGNTGKALIIPLTDDGQPLNLGEAVSVRVIGVNMAGDVVFDDQSPTLDRPAGIVTHEWAPEEVEEPRRIYVEVIVTWPTFGPITHPEVGLLVVDIGDGLA